jgi:hypothetical protein
MKKQTLNLFVVTCLLVFSIGCKKDKNQQLNTGIKVNNAKAAIPTYVFDWETVDYMPTPPGTTPILVPWASGSNQLFSDEIAFDFKKIDGWNLVYNTFSPTQLIPPNFFALYNKYRGIIRFYLYIPPGNPEASSYFSDGLGISGQFPSSIMNFSKEIIDVDNVQKSITKVQNYQIQSTGGWYACQYELAYDPSIAYSNQENLNLVWNVSSTNLSQIVLNGVSNGTLTGTIGTANSGGFNLGSLLGNLTNTAVHAVGFKAIKALNLPRSKVFGTDVTKSIEDGVKGGLTGAVKGFFSAILGGSATSPQVVDLKLKVETNLQGTIANNSGIASPTLVMPGAANSNSIGYIPSYNKVMGVVSFPEPPLLYVTTDKVITNEFGSSWENPKYFYDYGLAYWHAPLCVQYNPEVTNDGTTIEITRIDVLAPYKARYGGPYIAENTFLVPYPTRVAGYPVSPMPQFYGKEIVGDEIFAYGSSTNIAPVSHTGEGTKIEFMIRHRADIPPGTTYYNATDLDGIRIRYTFLVTPSNGSQPITIIKTVKPQFNFV